MRNNESSVPQRIIIWSIALLIMFSSSLVARANSDKKIYQDPNEPFERRVQDLLARMTWPSEPFSAARFGRVEFGGMQ